MQSCRLRYFLQAPRDNRMGISLMLRSQAIRSQAIRSIAACCFVAAMGCSAAKTTPDRAYVHFIVQPQHAEIFIQDRYFGSAYLLQKIAKPLPVGVHYFTIKTQGFFLHDLRVPLPKGVTTIRVKLRKIPNGSPPIRALEPQE